MGIFNLQGFSAQKSLVSDGATANALNRIRDLLNDLLHSPETGVLHLQSDEGAVNITKGMIVAISTGANECVRAVEGGAPAAERGFAVCLSDSVAPSAWGYFRFKGEADVRLVNGLVDLDEAQAINLSTTDGLGTNQATAVLRRVGLIVDATEYVTVTNPLVRIVTEFCCPQVA